MTAPRLALAGIVVLFLGLGSGYILATPRWNNPDEPAHYAYLKHLATTGQFPVLEMGDWDQYLLGELTRRTFRPDDDVERLRYEGHQPPLYYMIMVPFYRAAEWLGSNARIVSLRWVNLALASLTIVLTYAATRLLLPGRAWLAVTAAGVSAFIPMHTAMSASINNDPLAELLAAAMMLALLAGLRGGFGLKAAGGVGLVAGLLLLTKVTVYGLVGLGLAVLLLKRAWRAASLVVLIAALVSGWWFLRNIQVYGALDPFGLARHDLVVVGQPRTAPGVEAIAYFLYSSFRSFWGQFGWMAVVIDPRLYALYLLLVVLVVVGLRRWWSLERGQLESYQRHGVLVLLAGLAIIAGQMVLYNLSFIQAQGRYLYPAMLPIAYLVALGWGSGPFTPGTGASGLGPALAIYWTLAAAFEALSWLVSASPAPLWLQLVAAGDAWLGGKLVLRHSVVERIPWSTLGLVVPLALLDAAALAGFVGPFFEGR